MSPELNRPDSAAASSGGNARIAALVVLATICTGCVMWQQSDPRLVRGASTPEIDALCGTTREAHVAAARTVLDEHAGMPFPNLTLLDKHGAVVDLDALRHGRTAVLFACCPATESVAWLQELEAQHWAPPAGYERLVIIAAGFGEREFDQLVTRKAPAAFFVGWPLQDYLTAVRIAPILFGVSATGTLDEYWLFEDRGRTSARRGSMQPNSRIELSVRPVTAVAKATAAPVRSAAHAGR